MAVNNPEYTVRTRNGYDAEKEKDAAKRTKFDADHPLGAALSGLLPKSDVPLDMMAAPFAIAGKKEAAIAVMVGVRQPIRETGVRAVRVQQRLDFATQFFVATDCGRQKRSTLGRGPVDRRLKQRLDLLPAGVRHAWPSGPSSRVSHALAVRHSRFAVEAETFSTCAASSMVSPPNARSSTM